jgi:hypothetical protein
MSDPQQPGTPASQETRRVVVVDVQMKFSSMVVFMIKWAIAAIPALIVIGLLHLAGARAPTGRMGTGTGTASSGIGACPHFPL